MNLALSYVHRLITRSIRSLSANSGSSPRTCSMKRSASSGGGTPVASSRATGAWSENGAEEHAEAGRMRRQSEKRGALSRRARSPRTHTRGTAPPATRACPTGWEHSVSEPPTCGHRSRSSATRIRRRPYPPLCSFTQTDAGQPKNLRRGLKASPLSNSREGASIAATSSQDHLTHA